MATALLATPDDVEALFGVIPEAQADRVDRWLRVASALVRQRVPAIDTQIAAGAVDAGVVADVVAQAVTRGLRNPGGVKSQTTGPFSTTYDDRVAAGFIYLTDDEVLLLGGSIATAGRRFGTVAIGLKW